MTVIDFLKDNPDWLNTTRTRIRMKLSNGDTPLICSDCFIKTTDEFWEELSKCEFIRLEPIK